VGVSVVVWCRLLRWDWDGETATASDRHRHPSTGDVAALSAAKFRLQPPEYPMG